LSAERRKGRRERGPYLSATKRDIHDGALVRHQGSERLDFVEIDISGKADTALHRQPVTGVLGTVRADHLSLAIFPLHEQAKVECRTCALIVLFIKKAAQLFHIPRNTSLEVVMDRTSRGNRTLRTALVVRIMAKCPGLISLC
jgi:hypothetical protein